MDSLSIDIYDNAVISCIEKRTAESKETPLQYVSRLILTDAARQIDVEPKTVIAIVESLFQTFALEYKDRFGVDATRENGEANTAVTYIVKEMMTSGLSSEEVFKKLAKAVQFYLRLHNNTDTDGNSFPYGLKYLFSAKNNHWLLRLCMEASTKMDDQIFQLMKNNNLSKEQAIRTLRRGDNVGSKKQHSKLTKLDEARKLWAELEQQHADILPKGFRFNPKIDGLFKSEFPTEDYIENAVQFLIEVRIRAERLKHANI